MFPLNRPTSCRIFLRAFRSTVLSTFFLSTFFFSSLIFSTRLLQATPESITVENSPTHVETVLVDDPENHPDSNGLGSVDHLFRIGKYTITAEQWCALLQAVATKSDLYGLFNEQMQKDPASCSIKRTIVVDPATHINSYCYKIIKKRDGDTEAKNDPDSLDRGKLPITHVDFYAAARYCNWLSLGQPNIGEENIHSTEEGPYTIQGKICRANFTPEQQAYDHSKWPGGLWRLPSEDEWYKAAYYEKATSISESHYWLYSTRSDSAPYNFIDENYNQPHFDAQGEALNGSIANANYTFTGDDPLDFTSAYVNKRTMEQAPYVTPVGTFQYSTGPFDTYDMSGNVQEWVDSRSNEKLSNGSTQTVQVTALRGGSWKSDDEHISSTNSEVPMATIINNDSGEHETSILKYSSNDVGFRVVLIEPKEASISNMISDCGETIGKDMHDIYNSKDGIYGIAHNPDAIDHSITYGIGSGLGGTIHAIMLGLKYFLELLIHGIINALNWCAGYIPQSFRNAFLNFFGVVQQEVVTAGAGAELAQTAAAVPELFAQLGGLCGQLYEISPTLATGIISCSLGYALYSFNQGSPSCIRNAVGLEVYGGGLIVYLLNLWRGAPPFLRAIIGAAV